MRNALARLLRTDGRTWHRYQNYLFLLPLFAVVLFYQIAYSVVALTAQANSAHLAFARFDTEDQIVSSVDRTAAAAGLHPGDRIAAINGQAFESDHVLYRELRKLKPGQPMLLMVSPTQSSPPHPMQLSTRMREDPKQDLWNWTLSIVLTAMMLACAGLGVYVAAVLPHDRRALILFGLLVSTAQMVTTAGWSDFPENLWAFANFIRTFGVLTWTLWLVLFGLYFPERFQWDLKRPWIKWLALGPVILWLFLLGLGDIASYEDFRAFGGTDRLLNFHTFNDGLLPGLGAWFFFFSLGIKARRISSRDAKRRLRILLRGCGVGLLPIGFLLLYNFVTQKNEFNQAARVAIITACLLFCVFPLTLAYVVVVERSMDLRVAVRQGVRYAFARGGLRVLSFLVIAGLITALNTFVFNTQFQPGLKILFGVVPSIVIGLALTSGVKRLRGWIDRRYFREAYQSEAILEQLSETVRTMVHERELFDTVAKRVSESMHVPQVCIFLSSEGVLKPLYCLGLECSGQLEMGKDSKTISLIGESKEPLRIYFDREDNWVHGIPPAEQEALKAAHAQLLLPIGRRNKLLGMFTLGSKLSDEPYSRTDIQLLSSVALQTGLALENSRLTTAIATEMAQRELLNREIEIAREVQERLFPQRLPVIAGIDYSGACRPALAVGGDYYDFLTLSNGDFGIAIGDVSGKGIAAALLMASLQASLRGQAMTGQSNLAQLMSNVNQLVFEATPVNRYATFFYGQYNRDSKVFTYVNAGHNAPMVLRHNADGSVHVIRLDTGGPVVGLLPKATYEQGALVLEPGDIFVGFTDGISEAMNSHDEEWGEDRLIAAVTADAGLKAGEIIPTLMAEADRFVSDAPQHDDMTLVVMKVVYQAPCLPPNHHTSPSVAVF